MKIIVLFFGILLLASCSAVQKKHSGQPLVGLKVSAEDTIVVIYNHGTRNPRKKERCKASYNEVPSSLKDLQSDRFRIYFLCSNATEGEGPKQAGNQIYARMFEIEQTIDGLIEQGILHEHIFLAGHSKGAWASLMLMNQVDRKFNGAVLFAPALANRASEKKFPWWREEVRPRQIEQMLQAKKISALIFAYEDDEYNRPQDLQFLKENYSKNVNIVAYRCSYEDTHNTHLHDCQIDQTKALIAEYIDLQIEQWYR